MDLQEALEVQVGHNLAILGTEELAELGVRHNRTLVAGVEAAVLTDIRRDELRHIRLALLGTGRQTHEAGQLRGDGAQLEEGVVRTASIVGGALLGGHRRGVLTNTALRLAGLTLDGLRGVGSLAEQLANTGGDLRAQGTQAVLDGRQEGIAGASLSGNGGSDHRGRRDRGGSGDRDIHNRGGGRRLLRRGGLGGGLLVSGHRVCINGGL